MRLPRLASLIGLVCLTLCSPTTQADRAEAARFYEEAAALYHQGKNVDAVIQLKNALQEDSQLLPARVLLGRIYVEVGLAAPAEEELERVLALGADRSLVAVPLARAYLAQRKHEELLDRVRPEGLPAHTAADVHLLRGYAQMELRDLEAAGRELALARALVPDSVSAIVAEGTLRLRAGDLDGAARLADQALAGAADDPGAWTLKGSVEHIRGNLAAAVQAYARALEADPLALDARLPRAGALLDLGRDTEAEEDVRYLRAEFAQEPIGHYLGAVIHARRGEAAAAREALSQALAGFEAMDPQVLARNPSLLIAAGLSSYGLGRFEQTKTYLDRYLSLVPVSASVGARRLLASALLALDQPQAAVDALAPARQHAPEDARLLTLLGTAYMLKGRHAMATELLERAASLSGGEPQVKTQLAFSRLAGGNDSQAVSELAEVFEQDASQSRAGLTLVQIYAQRGQHEQALRVAEALQRQDPDNLTLMDLLARSQVRAGQVSEARATWERVLTMDPRFVPARLAMARLDLAAGHVDESRARLQALVQEDPKSSATLVELARVSQVTGQREEAVRWLEKARTVDAEDLVSRLALVELYLEAQQPARALEVAAEAEAIAPRNLEVLAAVGLGQLASGNTGFASTTFRRMADLAGSDPRWLQRIARYQVRAGARPAAIWSLQKAIASEPDLFQARVELAELYLVEGRLDELAAEAGILRERFPDRAAGYGLSGDLLMRRGKPGEAAAAYRAALDRERSTVGALRLYQAERLAVGPKKALEGLAAWVEQNPTDMGARRVLAEGLLEQRDLRGARVHYEVILQGSPRDPVVLNNLANVLLGQGDPGAIEHARRAVEVAPDDAAANDTLGWILVKAGQAQAGLAYLRAAQTRNAGDPEVRYHVAVALAALGRADEARAELQAALRPGRPFTGIEDARALAARLGATAAEGKPGRPAP